MEGHGNGRILVAVTESSQNLVEISTRSTELRKRTPLEKMLFMFTTSLFFTCFMFLIVIIILGGFYHAAQRRADEASKANTCVDRECIESAYNLLNSINKSADPCQDFYQFACGNWRKAHPPEHILTRISWFGLIESRMALKLRDILTAEKKHNEPVPVQQTRMLFNSCMDTDSLEKHGVYPILDTLAKLELPRKIPTNATTENFNLARSLALAHRVLRKGILVGFGVTYLKKHNMSIIDLKYPSSKPVLPVHRDFYAPVNELNKDDIQLDPWKVLGSKVKYVSDMLVAFDPFNDRNLTIEEYSSIALDILDFNSHLNRVIKEKVNVHSQSKYKTFAQLQEEMDKQMDSTNYPNRIDWNEYLDIMFKEMNININIREQGAIVRNHQYFLHLPQMLSNYSTLTIQRHLWFAVVMELASHTTRYMRYRQTEFVETLFSVKRVHTRTRKCVDIVKKMMPSALSYAYADESYINDIRIKIREMLKDIQDAFRDLVSDLDWANHKTKELILEKSDYMRTFIGVPEWLHAPGKLENIHQGIVIKDDTYLENLVQVLTKSMRNTLGHLIVPDNGKRNSLPDPLNVNAFYIFQFNFIDVPIGILNFPFYGLGLQSLNYGALGTILGHELTHGFDNTGRMFDKHGDLRDWWNKTTVKTYKERAMCFVNQYSSFTVGDKHVNGWLTLGENIADNGGIRESIRAYRKYVQRNGPEPRLPGFEEYNHEQLLFLAFAHFCEYADMGTAKRFLSDPHSPGKYRIIGALSNSEEFSSAWKCPPDSPMNPTKKCQLW